MYTFLFVSFYFLRQNYHRQTPTCPLTLPIVLTHLLVCKFITRRKKKQVILSSCLPEASLSNSDYIWWWLSMCAHAPASNFLPTTSCGICCLWSRIQLNHASSLSQIHDFFIPPHISPSMGTYASYSTKQVFFFFSFLNKAFRTVKFALQFGRHKIWTSI